ncbi:MAG: sulfotransferase [Rhizomicrobium sp.]
MNSVHSTLRRKLLLNSGGSAVAPPDLETASALHAKAVTAFQRGDNEVALQLIERASANPETLELHYCTHAEILRRCGKLEAAEAAARRALACNPDCAKAWDILGTVLSDRGELAESSECYAAAIRIEPHSPQVLNNLAVVQQRQGRLDAAEASYRQALRLVPEDSEIRLNFATLRGMGGYYSEAMEIVERLLARNPNWAKAHLLAATLAWDTGKDAEALKHIDLVLAAAPEDTKFRTLRARILCRLERFDAALDDCYRVLAQIDNDADALHLKALALQGLNRAVAALEAFDSAEAAGLSRVTTAVDRAQLLAEMGRKDDALATLGSALALEPDNGAALYARANLIRYAPGSPDLAAMERIAGDPERPFRDRVPLSFALGKAYLDMGDGVHGFVWLDAANRLKRSSLKYNPDADARKFAEIAGAFTAEESTHGAISTNATRRPIFVFGMPRSGTTLIEHILASHGLVHGAGEPPHLHNIAEAFHAQWSRLSADELADSGRDYLARVTAGGSQAPWIVDKMPSNFRYAGLIPRLLPGARMIHCRRDPLDTCLSIYSLLFTTGHEYAYDMAELGRYYVLYRGLMAHWRRVLPRDSFLEIDYEMLVRDTEGEVRRILDFCGLPWDAGCLRFHENRRRVSSASLNQVREPIYTKSIGRARQFRPWLGALEAALANPAPA